MFAHGLEIQENEQGTTLKVKIKPGAGKNGFDGLHNGMIKISVTASPEKFKANRALISLLAKITGIPKSDIHILKGQKDRTKTILFSSMTADELLHLILPYI